MEDKSKSSYLCSPIRKENGFAFSFIIILSLSQESLRNELKKKIKKTSENIWQLKINPLPLHPLLKQKQQVL
ncbi:hypothetical protein [Bacteroides congonensis]|uniref:hypothetical protein n=1 Tax=Bacteroides congonensis TaxID=1871006 RepID=UPI0018979780|nr:hypothetical protein [Bacteroides congonensis]